MSITRRGLDKYFEPPKVVNGYMFRWSKDGLIALFDTDIIPLLNRQYPHSDDGGWYFNETRDRYIAEYHPDGISVNPQFVWQHIKAQ